MVRKITAEEADALLSREEGDFWDDKAVDSGGNAIQKIACAFANADGGEFAVGIDDRKAASGRDRWRGFSRQEDGNFIHQNLAVEVTPDVPYSVDWLEIDGEEHRGIVALVTVHKSESVHHTASGQCWIRRGAASYKVEGKAVTDLSLSKGMRSFEDQLLDGYGTDELEEEPELVSFLEGFSPQTTPEDFVRKQRLGDKDGNAKVAGAVLYAENPPAVLPRKCSIKVARYETREVEPRREHLAATPATIEGPAYSLIEQSLEVVQELIDSVPFLDVSGNAVESRYPPEALKEVIVNAVVHRDYNVSDDILIWVFDDRIEVRSPGILPGHMTLDNLLTERSARNQTINRLLNRYPNPPNQDIGEGLNTVFNKMAEAKLQQPQFKVTTGSFIVTLPHTPLARPEEIVMEYLDSHDEIRNKVARGLTGIHSENTMKEVFYRLAKAGKIERVPGKLGNASAWQKTAAEKSRKRKKK